MSPLARWPPTSCIGTRQACWNPILSFHVDPVKQFKLDKNQVVTEAGKTHEYDIMVIATGSRMVPDETPGLTEGAEFFYTEASAVKMYQALREFQGGRVAVAVGVPHKCPIARSK